MTKVNKQDKIPVVCAVIVKDGRILSTQRSTTMPLSGKWEFPGGKVNTNESEEQALKREIMEELRIDIVIEQRIGTTDSGDISLTAFLCKIQQGDIRLTEHSAFKWCDQTELSSLDWAEADLPFVRQLLETDWGVWAV